MLQAILREATKGGGIGGERRASDSSGSAHAKKTGSSAQSLHTGMTSAGGVTSAAPAHHPSHTDDASRPSSTGGPTGAPNLIDLQSDTPSVPAESINGPMATLNLN